ADADELLAAAAESGRVCVVNFVLRYNDVIAAARRVLDTGVLGGVLAGRLTNCAFDTALPPDHWFWDKRLSGGIFIEHGVHFFDLYRYLVGPCEVLSAHAAVREGTGQEDRVLCCMRCGGEAIVTHYHGFDQIKPMDRADHRLVCELGDLRIFGWIPLSLEIDAAVNDAGAEKLAAALPGCRIEDVERFEADRLLGRGEVRRVTRRVRLRWSAGAGRDKSAVYADSARRLLADQVAFIREPSHVRRVTEQDGRTALAVAAAAAKLTAR
ncbi:MAG: gfo/Idh/MocA family oxidoreductase, partial [Planctomycetes bacterium]|nr:gfo/Idh/MocA family oxidoreductase [Planctomycetota bacterium]